MSNQEEQDSPTTTIEETKKLNLPSYCIVPYKIRADKNIYDSLAIYYGELCVLSCKEGYLWATDEQLAEMKAVDDSTIERWNKTLEDHGYIFRETYSVSYHKEGKLRWKKKRKLWVEGSFQKKIAKPLPKRDSTEPLTKKGYRKLDNLNQENREVDSIDLSQHLKDLPLSDEDKFIINKNCPDQEKLQGAIAFARQDGFVPSNLAATIQGNYNAGRKLSEKKTLIDENKKIAEDLAKKHKGVIFGNPKIYNITIYKETVMLGKYDIFYSDKEFKNKLNFALKEYKLD